MANGERFKGQQKGKGAEGDQEESQEEPFAHLGGLRFLAMRRQMRPRELVPLPDKVRTPMEQSFGESFSDVKMHPESPRAGGSTHALAEGNTIHFAPGRFDPESAAGKRLIGHELAHVVQQRGRAPLPQAFRPGEQTRLLERDADQAGACAAEGKPARVQFGATASSVQKFESWEHDRAGGDDGKIIRLRYEKEKADIWLSRGEANALMGDLYATPAALKKAPYREVVGLIDVLDRQRAYAKANGGAPTPEQQAEIDGAFQEKTAWREETAYDPQTHKPIGSRGKIEGLEDKSFASLALDNDKHFAIQNINLWQQEHQKALELAKVAGAHEWSRQTRLEMRREKLSEANLQEAFACHFLVDAFSSGHLISGRLGRQLGEQFWQANFRQIILAVNLAISADGEAQYPFSAGPDKAISKHALPSASTEENPRAQASQAGPNESEIKKVFDSVFLKLVHDYLSQTGIWVRNKRGDIWKALGDGNLHRSPETQRYAAEAVQLSRRELEAAANGGPIQSTLPPDHLVPHEVSLDGQKTFISLEQFSTDPKLFDQYLAPLVLDPTSHNKLYRFIKGNARALAMHGVSGGAELGRSVGHTFQHMWNN